MGVGGVALARLHIHHAGREAAGGDDRLVAMLAEDAGADEAVLGAAIETYRPIESMPAQKTPARRPAPRSPAWGSAGRTSAGSLPIPGYAAPLSGSRC
jgi:hypothetical protein